MCLNDSDLIVEHEEKIDALTLKIDSVVTYYEGLVTGLEGRLESTEQVSAQLLMGYAEMAANVEAILSILSNASPEDRQELQATLTESRMKMLEVLKKAADDN